MKIYLCADIEGVTGFSNREDAHPESPNYPSMATQMSLEVRAACEGFLQAGATEILVEDCHGNGRNIVPSRLPPSTSLISGVTYDIFGVTGNFTGDYDALAFVGYHDDSCSDGNPAAHTMSSRTVRHLSVNGETFSEFHIHAYAASRIGVPVIFLSGDDKICHKAEKLIPGITTFSTLTGCGNASIYSSPENNLHKIQKAAEKSLRQKDFVQRPAIPSVFHVRLEYVDHFLAKKMSHYPGAIRLSPYVVGFDSDDYQEVLRFFSFAL